MKEKIIGALAILVISISAFTLKVYASDNRILGEYSNIIIAKDRANYYYLIYCDSCSSEYYNSQYRLYYTNSIESSFNSYQSAVDYCLNNLNTQRGLDAYTSTRYYVSLYVLKGSVTGTVAPDTQYPNIPELRPPEPQWYDVMWDTFKDYFTNPVPFEWFKNLIDKVFGDENNGGTISDNVTIGNPTIAPTPTPIPYTTVVIPKTDVNTGETYYETNYYYVNPSGTPIITSYPPVNSPSNNGGGDGGQTYSPVNGKPYSIPKLDWLSTVDIDGTGYDGIDSIGDGMSSVDEIGSEYADGMSAVQDASGTLPSSWLLLIGIVAAIPLLAGIVSRLLGG